MFLDALRRRNPGLLEAAVTLHGRGELPANSVVLDLDAITENARALRAEADCQGLELLAMTKQIGRNPDALAAIRAGGIEAGVAVDMACARPMHEHGMRVGHLGHLVQVPRAEAAEAAAIAPDAWTVFSDEKGAEAAGAAASAGREQALLARVHAEGDRFYPGHEGGFPAEDVLAVAERLGAHEGARFAGVTTFPALLFDRERGDVVGTPNLRTLERVAGRLRDAGLPDPVVNAPGTTSAATLATLAAAGATHAEPGHGLTGTTPLHAVRDDLVERPAALYLTEVSHHHAGRAYVFGGGLYVDPVLGPAPVRALAGPELRVLDAHLPDPAAIDYYAQLTDSAGGALPPPGTAVLFGFRVQAFVTRAYVVGVRGAGGPRPEAAGIWAADGSEGLWRR